jgi:mono/diheme cytochrome c family protein
VFRENCAQCHGTYGESWTYPNKIVPLEVIGTDPVRATGLTDRYIAHYNASWFGQKKPVAEKMTGYQAPPLDGVWATAPYLHNGSVPTLEALLDSSKRLNLYLKPPSTGFAHYDRERVGWKVEVLDRKPEDLDAEEAKRLFDSSRWGFGNDGHLFGDVLTDDERRDVIEYLKTL